MVISQFPLDTSLKTDYIYITKSSDQWRVTLVELESPDKPIFTNNERNIEFSQKFNAAVAQVRSWKVFLRENKAEVERRLRPLIVPEKMRSNPIEFQYQLIIGRSDNKNASQAKIDHFNEQKHELGIDIMTYDGLMSYYENGRVYKKNIVVLRKAQYAFKYMHICPQHVFAYLGRDVLILDKEFATRLIDEGYDIPSWKNGKLLVVSGKFPMPDRETLCSGQTLSEKLGIIEE